VRCGAVRLFVLGFLCFRHPCRWEAGVRGNCTALALRSSCWISGGKCLVVRFRSVRVRRISSGRLRFGGADHASTRFPSTERSFRSAF
jgi:hypothetical protein